MNPMFFVRMAKWARNPPSKKMLMIIFGIVGFGIALVLIETYIGWPDFLTVNKARRSF